MAIIYGPELYQWSFNNNFKNDNKQKESKLHYSVDYGFNNKKDEIKCVQMFEGTNRNANLQELGIYFIPDGFFKLLIKCSVAEMPMSDCSPLLPVMILWVASFFRPDSRSQYVVHRPLPWSFESSNKFSFLRAGFVHF